MNQSTSQDHVLAKAGHGKPDASKIRMHGAQTCMTLPMATVKHRIVCLLSDACMWPFPNTRACGMKRYGAVLKHEASHCMEPRQPLVIVHGNSWS